MEGTSGDTRSLGKRLRQSTIGKARFKTGLVGPTARRGCRHHLRPARHDDRPHRAQRIIRRDARLEPRPECYLMDARRLCDRPSQPTIGQPDMIQDRGAEIDPAPPRRIEGHILIIGHDNIAFQEGRAVDQHRRFVASKG